jgi:hypothetical protein
VQPAATKSAPIFHNFVSMKPLNVQKLDRCARFGRTPDLA